jgi:hypothetical protein
MGRISSRDIWYCRYRVGCGFREKMEMVEIMDG